MDRLVARGKFLFEGERKFYARGVSYGPFAPNSRGERYPELASLPAEKLIALTCEDLRILLGVRGQPVFRHTMFYPRAIPQYNLGYGRYQELMAQVEAKAPGFFLAGNYRDGVSLSDSIVSGCNVAERVEKHLLKKEMRPQASIAA